MRERTYEITDYCPHNCPFCSSDTTDNPKDATFMSVADIAGDLAKTSGGTGNFDGEPFDRIIISGGEPLAHPQFYQILKLCEEYTKDVVVYSNAIRHIIYNTSVIDGIYVEANLTVLPNVEKLHVLKRVEQGREAKRPEVKFSNNWDNDCSKECEHVVVRPDGSFGRPCLKSIPKEESLSPREVSILSLLRQKSDEEPVDIKELGLSEPARHLAENLLLEPSQSWLPTDYLALDANGNVSAWGQTYRIAFNKAVADGDCTPIIIPAAIYASINLGDSDDSPR